MNEKRWITWRGKRILVNANNNKYKYQTESINYGQFEYKMINVFDNNNRIGYVEYLKGNGKGFGNFEGSNIFIKNIEVNKNYRRKGIATKLYKMIQKENNGKEIRFGNLTSDGMKLINKIGKITREYTPEGKKEKVYFGIINNYKKED